MTVDELKIYYASLLINQYRDKPKAFATVKAVVDFMVMDLLPTEVRDAFDIETAVGVQLDTLGMYQGIDRYSWGPNGDFTLTDDEFRSLIKMAIVKNSSNSSLKTIVDLLNTYFPTEIQVFDSQNMKIHYMVDIVSDNLLYAFINEVLLPKPMGVQLTAIIYADNIDKVFGFRTYAASLNRGVNLNNYTNYQSDTQFITYTDNIQGI